MGRHLFDGKDYDTVILKLEQAWAIGASDVEAAAFADISAPALCDFLKKNPEISERKERLKQQVILAARNAIYDALKNKKDAKIAIQFLERKLKREFSTLQEISGADGQPLNPPGPDLSKIPTEKLKLIRDILNGHSEPGPSK